MRVQVLQHVPFEGLGSIASWLEERHADVVITRSYVGDPLPTPGDADLVIALGGPMSVTDDKEHPWLAEERLFLERAVRVGGAVLGICLGAQLLASALGADVVPGAHKEIGWFPVRAEARGADVIALPETFEAFHWHGDTFGLPPGAVHVASSRACRHQGFQVGRRTIGLQFHLETTAHSVEALVGACSQELVKGRFIQSREQLRAVPAGLYARANGLMAGVLDYLVGDLHLPRDAP